MGVELLTERYKDQIAGVLSSYDRIIIQGTVPGWCYASGMTDYFYQRQIRTFDYPKWAEPSREALRKNMERIAADNRPLFLRKRAIRTSSNAARREALTGNFFLSLHFPGGRLDPCWRRECGKDLWTSGDRYT